jgi:hypothetical protein
MLGLDSNPDKDWLRIPSLPTMTAKQRREELDRMSERFGSLLPDLAKPLVQRKCLSQMSSAEIGVWLTFHSRRLRSVSLACIDYNGLRRRELKLNGAGKR